MRTHFLMDQNLFRDFIFKLEEGNPALLLLLPNTVFAEDCFFVPAFVLGCWLVEAFSTNPAAETAHFFDLLLQKGSKKKSFRLGKIWGGLVLRGLQLHRCPPKLLPLSGTFRPRRLYRGRRRLSTGDRWLCYLWFEGRM